MGRLQGKRVIVTGGSTGIGAAIVARFLDEGAAVVAWCRDHRRGEAIKAALPKLADVALTDVADADAVAAAFTRSLSVLDGTLDVMICNAGISIRHDFTAITPAEFDRVMRINLYGSFHASQHAARTMLAGSGGTILFTASTSGVAGYRFYADYNASKGAIIAMMRTMALELAPKVRVNAVNPGYTLTPMQEAEYSSAMLKKVNDAIPMGRHARPAELAGLFVYLASDEAAYATGQVFTLDGGESTGTLAGNLSMSE
jgi:meso-butanediol dehydrogenase / (S,S)-butanediol dehydrogenase / diacetyl reductase